MCYQACLVTHFVWRLIMSKRLLIDARQSEETRVITTTNDMNKRRPLIFQNRRD